MVRILDFYAVRWEYEPHTFPILWNLEGEVVESFAPDFYLPDLDAYLEMTTLRQRLVRKKNRKLRRLKELYPDVRIKLFYARDFRALMLKYGRLAFVDGLSGALGQVPSPRVDGPAGDRLPAPLSTAAPSGPYEAEPAVIASAAEAAVPDEMAAFAPPAAAQPRLAGDAPGPVHRSRSARRRRAAAARRGASELASSGHSGFRDPASGAPAGGPAER